MFISLPPQQKTTGAEFEIFISLFPFEVALECGET